MVGTKVDVGTGVFDGGIEVGGTGLGVIVGKGGVVGVEVGGIGDRARLGTQVFVDRYDNSSFPVAYE